MSTYTSMYSEVRIEIFVEHLDVPRIVRAPSSICIGKLRVLLQNSRLMSKAMPLNTSPRYTVAFPSTAFEHLLYDIGTFEAASGQVAQLWCFNLCTTNVASIFLFY